MADLTITTFMTIDGVMQAPGGEAEDPSGSFGHGGWLVPHFDEKLGETMDDIFAKASAFLLGRRTFEIFASYWPQVPEDENAVAKALNTLPKHVATHGDQLVEWKGATVIRDVVADVPRLKAQYTGEIQVHGSSDLAQTLIKHDLVHEYRIITFPGVIISYYRNTRDFRTGMVE